MKNISLAIKYRKKNSVENWMTLYPLSIQDIIKCKAVKGDSCWVHCHTIIMSRPDKSIVDRRHAYYANSNKTPKIKFGVVLFSVKLLK